MLPRPGLAAPLTFDFETPPSGLAWSSTTTSYWEGVELGSDLSGPWYFSSYLGQLANETVSLTLMDYFDEPTPYRVSFDLLVFGSWFGNSAGTESLFTVGDGVTTLSQVSIASVFLDSYTQSYPDEFGEGSHPAGTGATAHYSLPISGGTLSIYHFDLVSPVNGLGAGGCCGDVYVEFTSNRLFGLDNVQIVALPEPSTGLLVGLGVVLVGGWSRGLRRRPRSA